MNAESNGDPNGWALSPLENGACKVDTRVHDEPALSQFYGFDADSLPAFSRIFPARFMETEYSRRSFRLP
jgi:hypothetical protein